MSITEVLTFNAETGRVVGNELLDMEVKENLISFRVLWKGNLDRVTDTLKTKQAIAEWLNNEAMEISLELCGTPIDGPIDLIFESHYSNSEIDNRLLNMHIRELLTLFRENAEIAKVWLKWNDITDDIIWTDSEAQIEMNRIERQKGDYILIKHQKYT